MILMAETSGTEVAIFPKTSLWSLYFTRCLLMIRVTGSISAFIDLTIHIFALSAITLTAPESVTEISNLKRMGINGSQAAPTWMTKLNLLGRKLIEWYTAWTNPECHSVD